MSADARSIPRRLLGLAWPIIGLNVLNVLALAVDTAMCGRLEEREQALAALGYATQVVFLVMVAMMGLTVGTVALVARAHGAGQTERVNHLLVQSSQLAVALGLGVGALGALLAAPILELLGATPEVRDLGADYLRPLMAGAALYYLNILYGSVLRGVGDTRLPFVVALGTNVVNFVCNYALILGNFGMPRLGVQGAAIGTLVSYAVGAVAMVALIRRGAVAGLHVPFQLRRVDGALASELFRVGLPAALDMLVLNAAFLSIIGMLGRIDQVAVAAHGLGLRVQALAFVPGMSIAQATAAMVGQALGAGRVEEARRVVRASIAMCTLVMTSLGVALIAGAHPMVAVFDVAPGTALESLSVVWMQVLGGGMPVFGVWISYSGMMQGAGATGLSLRVNLLTTFAIQIPLSLLLGFPLGLGPFGIWVAFPLAFVVKAALGYAVYRSPRWTLTGVHAR